MEDMDVDIDDSMDVDLPASGPSPRLNYDILISLVVYLPAYSTGRLMRTCKTLYQSPTVLRSFINFRTKSSDELVLTKYLRYLVGMHPPGFPRATYLRVLDLNCAVQRISLNEADRLLIEVLNQATGLKELRISSSSILKRGEVRSAMASLTSLRTLHMDNVDHRSAVFFLSALQSPINTLSLEMGYNFSHARFQASPVIHVFRQNLRAVELDIGWPFFFGELDFPRVEELLLHGAVDTNTAWLKRAFPALHTLESRTAWKGVNYREHNAAGWRRENVVAHTAGWPHLRTLRGSSLGLFMLGHLQPVSRVEINDEWPTRVIDENIAVLKVVLEHARPEVLILTVPAKSNVLKRIVIPWGELRRLRVQSIAPCTTFKLYNTLIDEMCTLLAQLDNVQTLMYQIYRRPPSSASGKKSKQDIGALAIAKKLQAAQRVPFLRTICIDYGGPQKMEYFQVTEDGALVELLDREELIANEFEDDSEPILIS